MAAFFVMGIKDSTNSVNSPQILPFEVNKPSPQLSIYIDDENFSLFDIKYRSYVYRCCLDVLGNEEDAKDITSSVFEKIHELKSKGRFDTPYPKTYIYKMAKNMSKNKRNKERREMILLNQMAADERINQFIYMGENDQKIAGFLDNGYEQIEAEIIVKAILDEQDETNRKIYRYKYLEDMTLEQIGEILGLVKSAVHKRIKKLEKQIEAAWRKGEK